MKTKKKISLKEKGWQEREIRHAEDVLEKEEKHDLFFSTMIFWSVLVVIIFANLMVSLVLIPFLIVLNHWILYMMIAFMAASIGFLYNFLITDIGHLEKKHHLLASIIVPIVALGNMVGMAMIANKFIVDLRVYNSQHNPIMISLVFGIAFIIPYFIDSIRLHYENKKPYLTRSD